RGRWVRRRPRRAPGGRGRGVPRPPRPGGEPGPRGVRRPPPASRGGGPRGVGVTAAIRPAAPTTPHRPVAFPLRSSETRGTGRLPDHPGAGPGGDGGGVRGRASLPPPAGGPEVVPVPRRGRPAAPAAVQERGPGGGGPGPPERGEGVRGRVRPRRPL